MSAEMSRNTAIEIVLDLATEEILTDKQVEDDPEILKEEQEKQIKALEIVRGILLG